jgi:hypothetical protein
MRVLDLCAGRLGISKVFASRGHKVTAIDLVTPPEIPYGVKFIKADILSIRASRGGWFSILEFDDHGPELWREQFDFGWASTPCENFSLFGMKHFHPNPPYPSMGLKLFNHAREILEESGIPYVMENVRSAQEFVGRAVNHCGSFHMWGNAVPTILPQGIKKGMRLGTGGIEGMNLPGSKKFRDMTADQKRAARKTDPMLSAGSVSAARKMLTASVATIPPELANCVAEYAERIIEQRSAA